MKILLVEDHLGVAQISCDLMREIYGHQVAHAATARQALELAPAFAPDLVLIDIDLPDMGGFELAQRLREQEAFAGTLLVTLTGIGGAYDPGKAQAADIDAHFTKPMDFSVLPTLRRRAA
jgi:CheY-like chemotaxis protein